MAEMTDALLDRYSMLEDDWAVDGHAFTSPLVSERPDQTLLFGDRLRTGR